MWFPLPFARMSVRIFNDIEINTEQQPATNFTQPQGKIKKFHEHVCFTKSVFEWRMGVPKTFS